MSGLVGNSRRHVCRPVALYIFCDNTGASPYSLKIHYITVLGLLSFSENINIFFFNKY